MGNITENVSSTGYTKNQKGIESEYFLANCPQAQCSRVSTSHLKSAPRRVSCSFAVKNELGMCSQYSNLVACCGVGIADHIFETSDQHIDCFKWG